MRIRLLLIVWGCLLGSFCSSCVGHKELVAYQQISTQDGSVGMTASGQNSYYQNIQVYKIRPFDQLMIRINAFDGKTEDFINREFSSDNNTSGRMNFDPPALFFNSYAVTDSGNIVLPIVGKMKVEGLSALELKTMLDEALNPYLKFASASVKIANMRVTVLGEVRNPGMHYLVNEKNTILDALAMAGDLGDFANRSRVKIVRQTPTGHRTDYLDLTTPDFLVSEFYYVHPHDVIYVEPMKAKAFDVSARTLGVVFSAISSAALIANLVLNLKRN